jgi:copper chaperone NosL
MKNLIRVLSLIFFLSSCEVAPQEINYGSDACRFCKMTIVDTQHASQLVTVKGKAFKYDAVECMMNHLAKWDQAAVKYYLVSDYTKPKSLIDATKAHYLVSESIPSPMGEFLTAFSVKEKRDKILLEEKGEGLNWTALKERFK